jgi:predicted nucleotidyltransferase
MTMSTTTTTDQAERIIATLSAHEVELRRAGIRHLSLFGSIVRGDAEAASDVDLATEFDLDAYGSPDRQHSWPTRGPVSRAVAAG